MSLIDSLISENWLKTPAIINAFQAINRADFLPAGMKDAAELNEALPIGYGQTISQPLVVAFMLELLQPEPGQNILDIGCGSGYTTALLSHIIQNGKVIGIEIVPELAKFAEKNIAKYGFIKEGIVEVINADGSKGYRREAPFDAVMASAASNAAGASAQEQIPEAWKKQLEVGGRIVCPIGNSIWLFIKKNENDFEEKEFPGFVFVPLI